MEPIKTIHFLFSYNYALHWCCFLMTRTSNLIFKITRWKKKKKKKKLQMPFAACLPPLPPSLGILAFASETEICWDWHLPDSNPQTSGCDSS